MRVERGDDGVDRQRDTTWEEVELFRTAALSLIDEYQLTLRWNDLENNKKRDLIEYRRVLLDKHLHESANEWADAIFLAMPDWL
tara:strand:+ start:522 stop:773 length:252 start_codon:yes stop_codon:yes gene_type:complete